MKKITIKRITTEGIKENEGILYEANGYQFCLIESIEDQMYYAIELSVGCSSGSYNFWECSKNIAFARFRSFINGRSPEDYKTGLENAKIKYSQNYKKYGVKFPVNEPIL